MVVARFVKMNTLFSSRRSPITDRLALAQNLIARKMSTCTAKPPTNTVDCDKENAQLLRIKEEHARLVRERKLQLERAALAQTKTYAELAERGLYVKLPLPPPVYVYSERERQNLEDMLNGVPIPDRQSCDTNGQLQKQACDGSEKEGSEEAPESNTLARKSAKGKRVNKRRISVIESGSE